MKRYPRYARPFRLPSIQYFVEMPRRKHEMIDIGRNDEEMVVFFVAYNPGLVKVGKICFTGANVALLLDLKHDSYHSV